MVHPSRLGDTSYDPIMIQMRFSFTGPEPRGPFGSRSGRLESVLILVGIVLVAVNLRPAVATMGALLGNARAALDLSGFEAGLLTTLPVLAFGVVSALAPTLSRRLGERRATVLAVIALATGLLARASADSGWALLAWTALSCGGIAVANVLLPVLVKATFAHRAGFVTGMYTMAMQLGTAVSAATAVPIAHATGGWRGGLAVWGFVAVASLAPWLAILRQPATPPASPTAEPGDGPSSRLLLASPVTWGLVGWFGMQSLGAYAVIGWLPQIYRDAGLAPATAGLLLGLVTAVAAPFGLLLPTLAARRGDQRVFAIAITASSALGYGGLVLAPAAGAWLWTVLIGIGNSAFPLALTMIGMRARSVWVTTRLSALTQGLGYLLAAGGPLAVGLLHEASGTWAVPLVLLIALLVPQLIAGLVAGRDRCVEDTVGLVRAGDEISGQVASPARAAR